MKWGGATFHGPDAGVLAFLALVLLVVSWRTPLPAGWWWLLGAVGCLALAVGLRTAGR